MSTPDGTHPLAERIAESIEHQRDSGSSRRTFLRRSALTGGGLLALGSGAGLAAADEHDEEDEEDGDGGPAFDDVGGTDVDVLNYALTLEHLEDAFYRQGLEQFDEADFVAADALQRGPEEARRLLYRFVQTVGNHESTHVEVLTQAVELLGGDPVAAQSYEFGAETVGEFLAIGQVLENTGVAAYAGAAPFIESPDLLGAALSIHSVEARHAALLNGVNMESPFPDAFDPAKSQDEVLEAAGQFIDGD
jgi:hypothetical protein